MFSAALIQQADAEPSGDLRGIAITARDAATGADREVKLYRQMHAVIIGIDKYQNLPPDLQLSYAVKDAKGIEKVLREQYSFESFYTLYNEQATRNGIMGLLQGKLSDINEDDGVFIFFAGHGTTQKDRLSGGDLGYILPYDGTFSKGEMYLNISMAQMRDEIAKVIPAKHVFYVIDACYSGTLLAQRAGGVIPKHDYAYLNEVTKESVRQVLTAGTDKQTVLDGGPKGHSVFTGRFIEKLEETDDYVTAGELGAYVKRRVASDAQARGYTQTPRDGSFYGLGDFVFVPSANKRALEMEKEAKRLEQELARLSEQELMMETSRAQQQREELERQKKVLETKQKIEELRQAKIAEAKQKEEERVRQELEAKKQGETRKKQEEERLAFLKMEIEKKRQTVPDMPMGQLSVDQAISRIKTLQSELLEIESKISEAVKGARLDYEQQLRGAKPGPKNEFESTAEFQRRVEVANERIERVRQDEDKAVDDIRVQFSKDLEEIRRMLKTLLNGEYPASNGKVNVELGQYDADKKEMAVLVRWTSFGKKYEANGYLRIESNDAKRLRDRQEFLTIKGYLKILPNVLKITLSRVEIFYGAENEWSTQVRWNNLRDIIAISVGKRYSTEPGYFLALKSDGTVWGWRQERPIQVPGLPNIKAMGVGPYHHLAVSDDGTVWGWGKNDWGQLGTRKEKYRPSPVQIPGLSHVIAIGAGENHSVALKDDGTVWAWGRNDVGQLGDGTIGRGATVTKDSPVQVSGLINITAISAGWEHNLALKGDGTVWGWGKNYNGEVGDGASGGVRETPVKLTGLSHVKGISAGIWSSMALKSDGTVWFWGQDTNGQNRTIPTLVSGLTKMMKIFTGSRSNLVLGTDGLVWAWGTLYNRRQSSPQVVSSLADVVDISAWEGDILALKDDGTVWSLKEQPVQILAPLSE